MSQPSLFDPRPGIVGRHSPDTSVAAALDVEPRTGTQRRAVLDCVRARGVYGMTDDEIQDALRMTGNTERPRRGELVDAGLLADSGRRRRSGGRDRIVWTATR